jgi:hypothetical protein
LSDVTHNPLILDTAAVISATLKYRIRKMVLTGNTAPAVAVLKNGAGQIIATLQCTAGAVDELNFQRDPLTVTGLELASITAAVSAHVDVYCN